MATTPLPIAPNQSRPDDFPVEMDDFLGALGVFQTEIDALGLQVGSNATAAATSGTNAASSEAAALVSQNATAADRVQTGLDRVQTGADRTAAAQSVVDAAALLDQFDDRYLGVKATDPTLDNDGNALVAGAIYINSVSGFLRAYTGSGWVQGISSIAGVSSVNGLTGDITNVATLAANIFTAAQEWSTGANIAGDSTINLDTATGNRVHITGAAWNCTAVTLTRGPRTVIFDGIGTLTHHATNNNLPGAANITTAAGDRAIYESDGTTVYCVDYIKASGTAVVAGAATALVFLSAVNASAVVTADIETTFNDTYDAYLLVGAGVTVSSDGQGIACLMKISGAYATANYMSHTTYSGSSSNLYAGTSGATTYFYAASGVSNAAGSSANFVMTIYKPASTSLSKQITCVGVNQSGTEVRQAHTAAINTATGALTGIRFYVSVGTLSGTFRLYGIANS